MINFTFKFYFLHQTTYIPCIELLFHCVFNLCMCIAWGKPTVGMRGCLVKVDSSYTCIYVLQTPW